MEKIGDIKLQNTVDVKINCQINEEIVGTNFKIIMDCLKELQKQQQRQDSEINKINQLKNQLADMRQIRDKERRQRQIEKNNQENYFRPQDKKEKSNEEKIKEKSNNDDKKNQSVHQINDQEENMKKKQAIASNSQEKKDSINRNIDNSNLLAKIQKNEKNIMDNIKDINVLLKEMQKAKQDIEQLKKNREINKDDDENNTKNNQNKQTNNFEAIRQINSEMHKNHSQTKQLMINLAKLEDQVKKLQKQVSDLKDQQNDKTPFQRQSQKQKMQDFDIDNLNDRLDSLSKKQYQIQIEVKDHQNGISQLNQGQNNLQKCDRDNKDQISNILKILSEIQGQLNLQGQNYTKKLQKVQKSMTGKKNREKTFEQNDSEQHSSRNFQSEKNIEPRKISQYTDKNKDLKTKINQLEARISYLEKMISGNKGTMNEDRGNPDKLPLIKKGKKNQKQFIGTHYNSNNRKQLSDLRNQIELWVKNYVDASKGRETSEDLQLKIQQVRNNLFRKADHEGMKKGLSFLENKINQLYLFLMQPETEDAMIVRKGFNCLSCSKKVEHLRGKLGPRTNWNNLTTTNYSPPKIGYSKPMAEQDREQD